MLAESEISTDDLRLPVTDIDDAKVVAIAFEVVSTMLAAVGVLGLLVVVVNAVVDDILKIFLE